MEKKLVAAKPSVHEDPPEVSPRDDVRVGASLLRCPYCHDAVEASGHKWVACKACLARHHSACWKERGACATCGGVVFLSARLAERRLSRKALAIAIAAALLAALALAAREAPRRRTARSPFTYKVF